MKTKKKYLAFLLLSGLVLIAFLYHNLQQPIVLKLGIMSESNWGVANGSIYKIFDKAVAEFEKSHPGVKIEYESGIRKNAYSEWLARKAIHGEMPDVFMVPPSEFYQYASLGILDNLEEEINNDSKFNKNYIYETVFAMGTYQGNQYALPFETVPKLMFVNKTLLEKENIEVPKEDWTWGNLEEIATKVTKDTNGDGHIDQFGITNYSWIDAMYSNGGNLFNEEGTKSYFANENIVEAVKFVQDLNRKTQGIETDFEDFNSGKVAFMPLTFSEYRTYKTYPYRIKKYTSFSWDCIKMPAGPRGENSSELDAVLMSVAKGTKQPKLAWEFLKFLTTDLQTQRNNLIYSQGVSPLEYVTGSKYTESIIRANMDVSEKVIDSKLLNEVMKEGIISPKFERYDEVMTLANSHIEQIYKEEKNVESSLKLLQRETTQFLRR